MRKMSDRRPIALLGATSRIAMDFIGLAARQGYRFALYARRPDAVRTFLRDSGLPEDWIGGIVPAFADASDASFSAVLNFVGVGDPARARAMGSDIFVATREADAPAVAYAERNPETPYIFMSSGAVYGTDFAQPATAGSKAILPINALLPSSYYSVAKLYAEAVHRASSATIIDVRIFNYVSRSLDVSSRFLLADLVRCIQDGMEFRTDSQSIWRDYVHPVDFFSLIIACMTAEPGTNLPVDCYSRAPIEKFAMLELLERQFALKVARTDSVDLLHSTGVKPFYFSTNQAAKRLGYEPSRTSAEGILEELTSLLA